MQTIGSIASGHKSNPRDIPNVFLTWDASVASSVTDAGAGAVSAWWDWRTGGVHQTVQGTNRPTTGTRTLNSLNVIDFDGTNDNLVAFFDVWTLAQPFTVWCVAKNDDGANGTSQVISDRSATGITLNKKSTDVWAIGAGSEITGGTADTNAHYFTAVYNGASSVLRLDGTQIASGNVGTNGFSNHGFTLGMKGDSTLFWDGYIAEFIMATGVAVAATIAATEQYLASKWGL